MAGLKRQPGYRPARVAMILSRAYAPDVRAQKEAHTLALAGYRVTVLAWDRTATHTRHMVESIPTTIDRALAAWSPRMSYEPLPVAVMHCQVRAGYHTGRRLLRTLPRYWWFVWHELRRIQPQIVHAHDLDVLPVTWAYARWAQVPLIYDMREYYPGMVRDSVGPTMSRALDALDAALLSRVDAVITVGERLAAYCRARNPQTVVVHNSQPLVTPEDQRRDRTRWRERLELPDGALLLVYVGQLTADRDLAPVLDAVPHVPGVWLAVAGDGPSAGRVRAAAARCNRVRPLGRIPLADVAGLVSAADVVYYGLHSTNRNSYYFMPNLAFFALAAGRPLLTTSVGEIAELVRREGWGRVLDGEGAAGGTDAAIAALRDLRDDDYRERLAYTARELGERRYNWMHDADRLLEVVRSLAPVV